MASESQSTQQEQYSVALKYEIFSFNEDVIKSINFQNQGSVLVFCSGQDNDSLKLVNSTINKDYMDSGLGQKVEFNAMQIKSVQSANLLKWSPNDKYLASACEKLVIWAYANGDLIKIKDFKDHELEIAAISWAPDSSRIASGSLDGKIVVRSLDLTQNTPKIKELSNDNKILGLVWDTYDKYLAALYSDNNVIIWKCNSWDKSYVVSLTCPISADHAKISSKRDDRKIDWSPDYRYVLLPSLDDKIVPFVCALDRQKDFKVCKTFMGPFSSINCVKFNPNLYANKETVINVFALGDNDGNISIWGIGDNYTARKPFFLFKSHPNGNELIEDICWNAEGNMLIATTLKKYIFVALFGPSVFGERLSNLQKQDFLEGKYGTLRTVAATNTKFKTFKASNDSAGGLDQLSLNGLNNRVQDLQYRQDDQKQGIQGISSFGFPDSKQTDINQEILTKVTYTEQKTFTENGKKRIIPSKQIITKVVVEKKEESQETNKSAEKMNEETPLQQKEAGKAVNCPGNTGNEEGKVDDPSMEVEKSTNISAFEEVNSSTQKRESQLIGTQTEGNQAAVAQIDTIQEATKDAKALGTEILAEGTIDPKTVNNGIIPVPIYAPAPNQPTSQPIKTIEQSSAAVIMQGEKISINNNSSSSANSNKREGQKTAIQKIAQPEQPKQPQPPHQQLSNGQILLRACKPIPNPYTFRLPSQQTASLSESQFLEIDTPASGNQITQIKCVQLSRSRGTNSSNNLKQTLWTDSLQGQLLYVELANSTLIYYTSNNLLYFVNATTGRRIELPLLIPNVCWLKINSQGYILVVLSSGELRVYFEQKILFRDNIMPLLQENDNNQRAMTTNEDPFEDVDKDPIENVAVDKFGIPVVFLKTRVAFMYSRDLRTWLKLDNLNMDIGCFYETNSLSRNNSNNISESIATKQKQQKTDEFNIFFDNLLSGSAMEEPSRRTSIEGQTEPTQLSILEDIGSYEERLIYLMRYDSSKNQDIFIDTVVKYIKKLVECKELNKIRQFITDIFANPSAQEFIFIQQNNLDQIKLFRSIKRILDYTPFASDLAAEIEEIVHFTHLNQHLS